MYNADGVLASGRMRHPLSPMPLSWSISRDTTLDRCERLYFFEYVLRARTNSRDERLREIAVLKKLKTIAMWQGEVFHGGAARFVEALRLGRSPDVALLLSDVAVTMHEAWARSTAKQYRERRNRCRAPQAAAIARVGGDETDADDAPAGPIGLFEHEYHLPVDTATLAAAVASVQTWLTQFVVWADAEHLDRRLRTARRVWIEPPLFGPTAPGFVARVGGALGSTAGATIVQVLTKVDLAIEGPDGRVTIYDWKTRTPPAEGTDVTDDAEYQVTVYQLWPHLTLGVPLDAIEALVVYVGADPVVTRAFHIDEDTRERALRRVNRAIRRALALHGAADHAPLTERDFDFAASPGFCRWCGLKRVCQESVSGVPLRATSGSASASASAVSPRAVQLVMDM